MKGLFVLNDLKKNKESHTQMKFQELEDDDKISLPFFCPSFSPLIGCAILPTSFGSKEHFQAIQPTLDILIAEIFKVYPQLPVDLCTGPGFIITIIITSRHD